MKTFYVNAPLTSEEHTALAKMAREEGRPKGQQLRHLFLKAIQFPSTKKKGVRKP